MNEIMNKTSAVAVCFSLLLLTCLAKAEQSPQDRADALFEQGVESFQAGDFTRALERFQSAFDASSTPALRFNIGVCHYNLGQLASARRELSAYLAETDPSLVTAERRERVEGLLADIDDQIGPAVAPEERTPATPPQPETVSTSHIVTSDETPELPASTLVEPESRRRISRAWFWVTTSLALALAVGGGVTGALVLGAESDFDTLVEECNSGARQGCTEDGVDIRDRGEAMVMSTNVLFATAGAFAVAAFVLAFFTQWSNADGQEASTGSRLHAGAYFSGSNLDFSLRF